MKKPDLPPMTGVIPEHEHRRARALGQGIREKNRHSHPLTPSEAAGVMTVTLAVLRNACQAVYVICRNAPWYAPYHLRRPSRSCRRWRGRTGMWRPYPWRSLHRRLFPELPDFQFRSALHDQEEVAAIQAGEPGGHGVVAGRVDGPDGIARFQGPDV
jgi:hypothetical protein